MPKTVSTVVAFILALILACTSATESPAPTLAPASTETPTTAPTEMYTPAIPGPMPTEPARASTPATTTEPSPTTAPTRVQTSALPSDSPNGCARLCDGWFWEEYGWDVEAVRAEIDRGADPSAVGPAERSPLSLALRWSLDSGGIKVLLEHGADPNFALYSPPLHYAVELAIDLSDPEVAERVYELALGEGLEEAEELGIAYVEANSIEIVRLLLEYGADTQAKNSDGRSALVHYFNYQVENERGTINSEVVRLLLEHGSDVDLLEDEGFGGFYTVDLALLARADAETFRLLSEHGADSALLSQLSYGLLRLAIVGRVDIEVLEVLLEMGLDPRATNDQGDTPCDWLEYAIERDEWREWATEGIRALLCPPAPR